MKILIIEDNQAEQEKARIACKRYFPRAEIIFASTFSYGVGFLRPSEGIGLVITDLMLPDDERDKKIKSTKPGGLGVIIKTVDEYKIPIVLCTSANHEEWGYYIEIILDYVKKMSGIEIFVITNKDWDQAAKEAKQYFFEEN